jgi:hypothetical protein
VVSELPFKEIWAVDFEFYGKDGDPPTPLCLVAKELRTGRVIRQWCDEFGPSPPYRIDSDAVFVAYMAAAEFGCHHKLGWGRPVNVLDLYVEYRCHDNDASVQKRPDGYFKLPSVLTRLGENAISVAEKSEMIDRILRGPPYSPQDRLDFLDYCEGDVLSLERLLPHMLPRIENLRHALHRGRYMWSVARMEQRGIPVDVPALLRMRTHWDHIRLGARPRNGKWLDAGRRVRFK